MVAEQESKDSGGASIAEQVLSIMEIILDEANAEISEDKVKYESVTCLHLLSKIFVFFELGLYNIHKSFNMQ